jgi:hypothetical protein
MRIRIRIQDQGIDPNLQINMIPAFQNTVIVSNVGTMFYDILPTQSIFGSALVWIHGSGSALKPMHIRNSVKIIRVLKVKEIYDAVCLTGCNFPPLVSIKGYEYRDFIFHELQARKVLSKQIILNFPDICLDNKRFPPSLLLLLLDPGSTIVVITS